MKKLLLACSIFLMSFAHAGTGGPDAFGYTWIDSNEPGGPAYSWVDIANPVDGNQILGLADDNFVGPINVQGVPFQYYWYTVSQFWIGSNGYISFNPVNIASPFPTIPTSGGPNDFIAAFMADLKFDGAGNPAEVWVGRNGDSTIISFIDVPFWTPSSPSYTGSNTFQIILNSADSSITLNYQSMSGTSYTITDTKVGIENISGAIGLQHSTGQYPANGYSIRFEYPSVVTYQVIDGSVAWNNNDRNAGFFLKKDAGPYDLSVNVANTGNQNLGTFSVTGSITNSQGGTPYSSTASVGPLNPGDDTTVVFGTQWNPTNAGYYAFNTSLSGISGDLTPSNNTRAQEIVVIDTNSTPIELTFSEPVSNGGGIAWNGGDGGIGVYYEPPTHPAEITQTSYWIDSDIGGNGFSAMIYDDDGTNGGPGTLLDSVFIPSTNIVTGQYTDVPTSQSIIIPDGGVYVLWLMGGPDIRLGSNTTAPFSLNCYEVLGGVWASYRDYFNTDFLIKMQYEPIYTTDIGVSAVLGPIDDPLPSGSSLVKAQIVNYGQTIVNGFDVTYRYDNQLVTESYQGAALAPGDSVVYNFIDQLTPISDTVDLCIWTSGTANVDSIKTNDTACVTTYGPGIGLIEETIQNEIYPNPALESFTFKTAHTGGVFELYDITGRRVVRFMITQHTTRVDVSELASGTYHYRVVGEHPDEGKLLIQ